tara:strand:+ start:11386 stop:12639 length:1254 start_codon:yes stop_codon:yes gene_type:complete
MQKTPHLPFFWTLTVLVFGACASSAPLADFPNGSASPAEALDAPSTDFDTPSSGQEGSAEASLDSLDALALQLLREPTSAAPTFDFGALIEATAEFSEADSLSLPSERDRFNKVRMRSVEIHGQGAVGDYGTAYAVIDMADGGAGSDFILREAAAWLGGGPGELRFRAGKYFADIGAWNRVYPSTFPSPNLDGVRREFLGGNLAATGVELHGGNAAEGFRWSTGLATDIERQNANLPGNGTGSSVPYNRIGLKNWAASCRLQWGKPESFQLGTSAWFSPGEVWTEGGETFELQTALWNLDMQTPFLGGQLAGEFWMKDGETEDSDGEESTTSMGYWGAWNKELGTNYSLGLLGSWWEHFKIEENAGHYYSGHFGYRLNEDHRLRLSLSHDNPGADWQKYYAVGLQWIVEFGSPRPSF